MSTPPGPRDAAPSSRPPRSSSHPDPDVARAATWAAICSGLLIAAQVAGKATRDALFLSSFSITSLPTVLIATSALSIAAVLGTSRLTTRFGPRRVFFYAAISAAVLHGGAWALVASGAVHAAALLVYAQTTVLGAIGVSVFWSRVNETFDPRSAKALFARIAGGGTAGGLVGGLMAERVAAYLPVATMLPLLVLLQLACAAVSLRIRTGAAKVATTKPGGAQPGAAAPPSSPFHLLASVGYLRDLALLVVLGTLAAALLVYVFKAETSAALRHGSDLLRAFAIFYAAAGLVTFVAQLGLSRWILERGGIAVAVSTLPGVVAAGGLVALAVPGLASAAMARGLESVLRSSIFRSGYELFYTPIPREEKRSTKPVIDVGFDRLGDVLGGAVAQGLLWLVPLVAGRVMLGVAAAVGVAGLLVARRLGRGYVQALERGLLTRALELDLAEATDQTTKSALLRTMGGLTLDRGSFPPAPARGAAAAATAVKVSLGATSGRDVVATRLAQLRSGDADTVRAALAELRASDVLLAGQVITLLAWDDVAAVATEALRTLGGRVVGQLVDALVDPKSDFAVRRRLPRVLGSIGGRRALDGLVEGLGDRRFEVRFQCARALVGSVRRERARVSGGAEGKADGPRSSLADGAAASEALPEPLTRERVLSVVERELRVGKRVWESQRLLDRADDAEPSPFVDEVLRARANRSLEHVFTLLSLVLPEQPLRVAFRGLHTDDRSLRGTALEYLDSVLPDEVRGLLLPLLEADVSRPPPRERQQALQGLLMSKETIDLRLVQMQGAPAAEPAPPAAEPDE